MSTLIEMCSWQGNMGWQGVICHHCQSTHNVMVGIPSIFCEKCGELILLSFSGSGQRCYKKPNYGFGRSVTNWAMRNFSPHRRFFQANVFLLG